MTYTPRRESSVSAFLSRKVRALGGFTEKLAPTATGMPDRIIFLPGLPPEFVELKDVGGAPSPAQLVWIARARELGVHISILTGPDEVIDWAIARGRQVEAAGVDKFLSGERRRAANRRESATITRVLKGGRR